MSENSLEDKAERLSSAKTYQSPTLTKVSELIPMLLPSEPYPQCANCPNSMWYVLNRRTLRCHCQLLRAICWDTSEPNEIPLCDGIYLTDEGNTPREPPTES